MATPNLVNVATVTPFTIAGAVTTSATDVIDVAADKTQKINSNKRNLWPTFMILFNTINNWKDFLMY